MEKEHEKLVVIEAARKRARMSDEVLKWHISELKNGLLGENYAPVKTEAEQV